MLLNTLNKKVIIMCFLKKKMKLKRERKELNKVVHQYKKCISRIIKNQTNNKCNKNIQKDMKSIMNKVDSK